MIMDWIIAIGGSDVDGNILYKFTGTAKEAKKKLMDIVLRDREDNAEDFDHGTSDMENIIQVADCENEFYAYNCFFSYHIDYTIKAVSEISDIRENPSDEEKMMSTGCKPLYTMEPLGGIKENGKDYEHFMIIQWSSTEEDSHEIGHKAYYLSCDKCFHGTAKSIIENQAFIISMELILKCIYEKQPESKCFAPDELAELTARYALSYRSVNL